MKKKVESGIIAVSAEALKEIIASTLQTEKRLELQGISLNPDKREFAAGESLEVELRIAAKYGHPLPELAKEVSEEVKKSIQSATGFKVSRVVVEVEKFLFN